MYIIHTIVIFIDALNFFGKMKLLVDILKTKQMLRGGLFFSVGFHC